MSTKHATEYVVPGLAIVLGAIGWIAAAIGGEALWGLVIFAIMAAYAALLLSGGRFAVTRVLAGRPADEREQSFDLRATAFAGTVVIACLIAGFMFELARGHSGDPFTWLCAVGGLSYLVAVVWLRWRG